MLPVSRLRRIWERMGALRPFKWAAAMGASPQNADGTLTVYGETWGRALAGLADQRLAHGLEAVLVSSSEWIPSPGEFRAMCLGLPKLEAVRAEINDRNAKRSPFAILVARQIDWWAYRHADAVKAERMLADAYDAAREAAMRGEPLPTPAVEIEHVPEPAKPADPEVAARAMAELRAKLGL